MKISKKHFVPFLWRLSSLILIPVFFIIMFIYRPIKWVFTGYYYPKRLSKARKNWLYLWIKKAGLDILL